MMISIWSFSIMKKLFIPLLMAFILSSCLSAREQEEAVFYATQNAQYGVVPPPKYQTLAATAFNLRLTPTPAPPATQPMVVGTPTMSFYEFSGTQAAQVQNNAMTSQAQQQQYEMQKLQAEQAAEQARQVAQAHSEQMTSQARATYMQGTANAEGTQVQNTAAAQGTATERVFIINSQATANAAAMTAVVQPTSDILTLQAARIQQTVEAGEAEKVELAVQRQQMKNSLDAYLPWAIILVMGYVFGRGFSTWVKTRTHPRDEHGRTQTFTRELSDGGVVIVKPEQMETGIVKLTGDGDVIRYAPMDKEEQSDINRRSQAVEAIAALPVPYAQHGAKMLGGEFGKSTPRVTFRSDNALNPVLDEADSQFLEGASDE
jgi:hypothetical protein